MKNQINFEDVILRCEVSTRGGGVEIDLTPFGFEGEKMAAYQNYLGGGMLGRVCSNNTVVSYNKPCTYKQKKKLEEIEEELRGYYHNLTNPDSEWESTTYEQNQSLPSSAY